MLNGQLSRLAHGCLLQLWFCKATALRVNLPKTATSQLVTGVCGGKPRGHECPGRESSPVASTVDHVMISFLLSPVLQVPSGV